MLLVLQFKFMFTDVSHENLCFKEKICTDLLEVVEKLGAGQCKLKGLLLCELYCTLTEVHKRKMYIDDEVRVRYFDNFLMSIIIRIL